MRKVSWPSYLGPVSDEVLAEFRGQPTVYPFVTCRSCVPTRLCGLGCEATAGGLTTAILSDGVSDKANLSPLDGKLSAAAQMAQRYFGTNLARAFDRVITPLLANRRARLCWHLAIDGYEPDIMDPAADTLVEACRLASKGRRHRIVLFGAVSEAADVCVRLDTNAWQQVANPPSEQLVRLYNLFCRQY